jgi:SAM-dependent methyltransferase
VAARIRKPLRGNRLAVTPALADALPSCRACGARLSRVFADLGTSPLSNAYLTQDELDKPEAFYPLKAYVCEDCFLVQLDSFETPERIFREYAYFSSYSDSWLDHCRRYAEMAIARFGLQAGSLVVEAASNDGYLLQFFVKAGIPVLGIEPAQNVARAAEERGVPTIVRFLGRQTASLIAGQGWRADLLIGNNVLAHVPDLNDFVAGLAMLLKPDGVLTLEFPHLQELIAQTQFDTIYHEHFSYFSLLCASRVLGRHGLVVFDVEQIPTHGGSLRLYAAHSDRARARMTDSPARLLAREKSAGLDRIATYASFEAKVGAVKRGLLRFLAEARERGQKVVGYGAPAKANTLLNYCGIGPDLLGYTVDRNPYKQGRYLPGSHIPVFAPGRIEETRPDYVLILPWNIRDEIVGQLGHIRKWGGRCVIPVPSVQVLA